MGQAQCQILVCIGINKEMGRKLMRWDKNKEQNIIDFDD